ncbi:MAG TPA: hypothetical protein VFN61_04605 [Acidimicrobiales bacterium]|nr:hypothetical protein [Acidimicrobiales bacterium]
MVLIVVVTSGGGPALYWAGQPITDKQAVLSQGESLMTSVIDNDEGTAAPDARCYFAVAGKQGHDIAPRMYCGPVRLPWSGGGGLRPWLSFGLAPAPSPGGTSPGANSQGGTDVTLTVSPRRAWPSGAGSAGVIPVTVGLPAGQELRRPDGAAPPTATQLATPVVPRQPQGWAGQLVSPPDGMTAAPVGDVMVAWGRSYRLIAYGQFPYLQARSAPGALRAARTPEGSRWGTVAGARPAAPLLLPAPGQVFAVAELAQFPGEMDSPVATGAGSGTAPDSPVLQVLGGGQPVQVPASPAGGAVVTVAAGVPVGSHPRLQVLDKGLVQAVSLADGALSAGPAVLTRTGTATTLRASARIGRARVFLSAASLVWFAGSDGGTVPPNPGEAYLEVLATTQPAAASLDLSAGDFTLRLPGGQQVAAVALPVQDRQTALMGFVVPASFSYGTVVVSTGGTPLQVPVRFS